MPFLSLAQITFADVIVVDGRIRFFTRDDDQAVARENHAVRGTVRWPRFSWARVTKVGHVPEIFCAGFLSVTTAFELHVAICRGLEPAFVARGIIMHHDELV